MHLLHHAYVLRKSRLSHIECNVSICALELTLQLGWLHLKIDQTVYSSIRIWTWSSSLDFCAGCFIVYSSLFTVHCCCCLRFMHCLQTILQTDSSRKSYFSFDSSRPVAHTFSSMIEVAISYFRYYYRIYSAHKKFLSLYSSVFNKCIEPLLHR